MSKQATGSTTHINSPSHLLNHSSSPEKMNLPPGFRFHPTDEELIVHYLAPKLCGSKFPATVISELDINKFEPWSLPLSTKVGEEWYFFCKKYRKYPTGLRTNRATGSGYWKATGKDKEILKKRDLIGLKKTLVFHKGRAPRGEKTNWVMHEYRKAEAIPTAIHNDAWVVCRVFCKNSGGDHSSSLACFSSSHGVENNFRMEKTEEMELFTDLQHEFFQDLLSDQVFS